MSEAEYTARDVLYTVSVAVIMVVMLTAVSFLITAGGGNPSGTLNNSSETQSSRTSTVTPTSKATTSSALTATTTVSTSETPPSTEISVSTPTPETTTSVQTDTVTTKPTSVSTPTSTTTTTSVQTDTDTATATPTPTDTIEPETGSISGTVFFDGYGSGTQDENEPGLEGTEVQLTNNDTERTLRTTTNSSGGFEFTNLSAGTYTLEPLKSTVPDWMSLDPENRSVNISLERGGSSTAKFGYGISLNLTTTPSANNSENSTEAGR